MTNHRLKNSAVALVAGQELPQVLAALAHEAGREKVRRKGERTAFS
jgi:hypothetical protein